MTTTTHPPTGSSQPRPASPQRPAPRDESRSDSLRRWTCGLSLGLFAGLLVVQAVVTPDDGDGAVMYDAAANQRGTLLASAALLIVSGMLMAPAAAGVLSTARGRGASFANVGAVLAVLGGTGHIALGYYYVMSSALPGGDYGEMTAYVDRLGSSAQLGIFVFPLLLCFALSVVAMPWAAYRAGAVGRWAPIVAGTGVLLHEGLPPEVGHQDLIGVAILVALTIVHAYLGLVVIRGVGARRPVGEADVPTSVSGRGATASFPM